CAGAMFARRGGADEARPRERLADPADAAADDDRLGRLPRGDVRAELDPPRRADQAVDRRAGPGVLGARGAGAGIRVKRCVVELLCRCVVFSDDNTTTHQRTNTSQIDISSIIIPAAG